MGPLIIAGLIAVVATLGWRGVRSERSRVAEALKRAEVLARQEGAGHARKGPRNRRLPSAEALIPPAIRMGRFLRAPEPESV